MPSRTKVTDSPYPEYVKVTSRVSRSRKVMVGETREIAFRAHAEFGSDRDWREGTVSVMQPDGEMAIENEPVSPHTENIYGVFVEFTLPGKWEILFEYGHGSREEEVLLYKIVVRAV